MSRALVLAACVLMVPVIARACDPRIILGDSTYSALSESVRWGPGNGASTESDRDVCFRVPEELENGVGVSSECIPYLGLTTECADDFVIESDETITHVTWWGTFYCNAPPYGDVIQSFELRFYEDQNCLPGDLVAEIHVPNDCNQTLVYEAYPYQYFRFDAAVSFSAAAGRRYWFSAQSCEHIFPPQWARLGAWTQVQGCEAVFRGAYFGYPDWTPFTDVVGVPADLSIEIECGQPTIARQTSWGGVRAMFR